MKAVVQRVASSRLTVGEREVSRIGPGLVCYLGIEAGDSEAESDWVAHKLANLRVLADDAGRMNLSVLQTGQAIMVVSQFTLLGDLRRGFRPGFSAAEEPGRAATMVDGFIERLRREGVAQVVGGEFGADMTIEQVNRGPVTIWIDSRRHRGGEGNAAASPTTRAGTASAPAPSSGSADPHQN